MPSFNHERFISQAISGVLGQSYTNLEVIIVDDASTDRSAAVIAAHHDRRIRSFILERNIGGAAVLNAGIKAARGDLIAICDSDDVWEPEKIERQVALMQDHPEIGACFSDASWIGGGDEQLGPEIGPLFEIFAHDNRSRQQWMKRLVEGGNCLCHSTALLRRDVFERVGTYCPWLRQIPDLHMWLRVLEHSDIFVLPERLVRYRWHAGNVSTPGPGVTRRASNEHRLVLREFFERISRQDFHLAFGGPGGEANWSDTAFRLERARYLMGSRGSYENMLRQLGWEFLFDVVGRRNWDAGDDLGEVIGPAEFQAALAASSVWIDAHWGGDPDPAPAKSAEAPKGELVGETTTLALVRIIAQRLRRRLPFRG
jgi:glycosyltransferase involved in cell wall biosynthesis